MLYHIQEMQSDINGNNTAFLPVYSTDDYTAAQSAYFQKCASACISQVPMHTILTYNSEGQIIFELTSCFRHEPPVD